MGMGMGAVSVAARTGHPPSPAPVSPSPGGTVSWPWGSSLFFFSDSLLGCSPPRARLGTACYGQGWSSGHLQSPCPEVR